LLTQIPTTYFINTATTVAPNRHDNDNEGPHLQHQPIPNPKPPQRVKAVTAAAGGSRRNSSRASGMFFSFFFYHILLMLFQDTYIEGIQPRFDILKARHFAGITSVLKMLYSYYDIIFSRLTTIDREIIARCIALLNQADPDRWKRGHMVHGNHSFCECVYAPYFWSGS
jgi:hypothetical protein